MKKGIIQAGLFYVMGIIVVIVTHALNGFSSAHEMPVSFFIGALILLTGGPLA